MFALDQFLRLGLGARRIAAGVGRDELHFTAGESVVLFLQIGDGALLHLDAALRERARLDGQQTELERRTLRMHVRRLDGREGSTDTQAFQ